MQGYVFKALHTLQLKSSSYCSHGFFFIFSLCQSSGWQCPLLKSSPRQGTVGLPFESFLTFTHPWHGAVSRSHLVIFWLVLTTPSFSFLSKLDHLLEWVLWKSDLFADLWCISSFSSRESKTNCFILKVFFRYCILVPLVLINCGGCALPPLPVFTSKCSKSTTNHHSAFCKLPLMHGRNFFD